MANPLHIILIGAVLWLSLFAAMPSNDAAMAVCTEKHSFDVCFHSLNR